MQTIPARGFTLIELLVATTLAAILATLAYPSFSGPLHKARRADGITALLTLQMAQEQWRAQHAHYASLSELGSSSASSLRYYALTVSEPEATGYTLTATATGAQAHDSACRVLRLSLSRGQVTRASGADAEVANAASDNQRCWGL